MAATPNLATRLKIDALDHVQRYTAVFGEAFSLDIRAVVGRNHCSPNAEPYTLVDRLE
jgi:hypothetical protein